MDATSPSLTSADVKRYNRQLILEGFGYEAQIKLKQSKVAVIGAGGLGSPVLQYLAAAGVGNITIIDNDVVDETNLHRQVLYTHADIGLPKAKVAADRLKSQNPFINVLGLQQSLNKENALELFQSHDVVVDGSDNFATRYLCNDASVLTGTPLVFGAIFKYQGQVAVFNWNGSGTYRCLFPEPPNANEMPNCSEAGVLGVLPGIIGCVQANECIKLITGIGIPLANQLWVMDIRNMESHLLSFATQPNNHNLTSLLDDYETFCGAPTNTGNIQKIAPQELKKWIDEVKDLQLIDVRELWERELVNIGGIHLPLNKLKGEELKTLDKHKPTIVYCHHGIRSQKACDMLLEMGFKQLFNLKGGIHLWALEIDNELETY